MAITIDQFLRDLTERRLLSGEEASAFRRKFVPSANDALAATGNNVAANGSSSKTMTKTAPTSSPLILCNCLLKERIQDDQNHLIFLAQHLQNNASVSLHVLRPQEAKANTPISSTAPGKTVEPFPNSPPQGILDVGRHGELVCVCCQTIEAESLHEIVQQYEQLPLELATESLLQTVKTLEQLQNRGLQLNTISADQLLLDEDGHIHLTGRNPATFLTTPRSDSDELPIPTPRLLEALGTLYLFLQTGDSDAPSSMGDEAEAGNKSTQLVSGRLMGSRGLPRYESWEELIRDLESLLKGQELSLPASQSREPLPQSLSPEPKPATPTPASAPAHDSASPSKWGILVGLALVGLALVVGLVIAAVTKLLN